MSYVLPITLGGGEQNAGNSPFSALSSIGSDKWRPVHIVINYVVTFITGG